MENGGYRVWPQRYATEEGTGEISNSFWALSLQAVDSADGLLESSSSQPITTNKD